MSDDKQATIKPLYHYGGINYQRDLKKCIKEIWDALDRQEDEPFIELPELKIPEFHQGIRIKHTLTFDTFINTL